MESKLTKLLQIGIIVQDVDKAVKHYEEDFGIGPWRVESLSDNPLFKEMTVDGKPSEMKNRAAFCEAFGMEWELIQPIGDSAYKSWLDEHGPGIHHIAVLTRDPYDKFLDDCKKLSGKDTWMHGECKTVGMDFSYVDLTKELGLFLEVYNEDKSKTPGHDY